MLITCLFYNKILHHNFLNYPLIKVINFITRKKIKYIEQTIITYQYNKDYYLLPKIVLNSNNVLQKQGIKIKMNGRKKINKIFKAKKKNKLSINVLQ